MFVCGGNAPGKFVAMRCWKIRQPVGETMLLLAWSEQGKRQEIVRNRHIVSGCYAPTYSQYTPKRALSSASGSGQQVRGVLAGPTIDHHVYQRKEAAPSSVDCVLTGKLLRACLHARPTH